MTIDRIPLPSTQGALWLCGRNDVGPDPEAVLAWAVDKMEERYDLLRRARVRSIAAYNELRPDEILRRVQPVDEEDRKRAGIPDYQGVGGSDS